MFSLLVAKSEPSALVEDQHYRDPMTSRLLAFPGGFLWGTATAAHQVEGGNVNSDWWEFEHRAGTPVHEPSGDACDSLHRFDEDLDLVAAMGLNSYRFSVEWARIEPEPGEFSVAALDHYLRICEGARDRGLLPVVTFHHFSAPRWLAELGGFESSESPQRFAAYVARTTARLGDEIGLACTINEPNILGLMGYGLGLFPPGVSGAFDRAELVAERYLQAHREAVTALRAGPGSFPIGLTISMAELVALEGGEAKRDEFQAQVEDRCLAATEGDDFVGVQCYTRFHFGPDGLTGAPEGSRSTLMGYEWWPRCVAATVRRAAGLTGLPIVVTENGLSTHDDDERIEYLVEALSSLHQLLDEGVDVRGYFQWSLLDNFEWAFGYEQRFGLVEVDRRSFARRPKPSAAFYGQIARTGRLELFGAEQG
jgi:beta-glucosidase